MHEQDFPIDDSAYVVTFPCFILSNTSGASFDCSDLAEGSGIAVALLTNTDALDSYHNRLRKNPGQDGKAGRPLGFYQSL